MVATQEALGPSVGPLPGRSFDAVAPTAERDLDRQVGRLAEQARPFARLSVAKKIDLLRDLHRRTADVASEWVRVACGAKGISLDEPVSGEEWIAGPAVTLRNIRFLITALGEIARTGVPLLADKRIRDLAHGAVGIQVAPYDGFDGALYGGITGETRLKTGIGRADVPAHQA
ncbi:MAG: hypothetical protein ACRENE_05090, partial [Polyangiaceae bacterium]